MAAYTSGAAHASVRLCARDGELRFEVAGDGGAPGTGGGGPGLDGGAPGLDGGAPGLNGGAPGTDGGAPGTDGSGPGADGGAPGTDGSGPGADRRLDVADGGPGADLQAMADRIDALGGQIRIDPAPGRGTRISGSVPATAIG